MKEKELDYDVRRNLAGHHINYENLVKTKGDPKGDCRLCADVTCLFNITEKKVLAALEKDGVGGDNVRQFSCDDGIEDTSIKHSLRYL